MVTDFGCLAWNTWKRFFTIRERLCLKFIRAGPKATPLRSQSQFSKNSYKNLGFFMSLWKAKNSRLRIWDSLSLGLCLNSLHLPLNLRILGALGAWAGVFPHQMVGNMPRETCHHEAIQAEVTWGFLTPQSKMYYATTTLRQCCPHLVPSGTTGGGIRDLEVQSWAELGTVGAYQ